MTYSPISRKLGLALLSALLTLSFSASPALAHEDMTDAKSQASSDHHQRARRWVFAPLARYYGVNNSAQLNSAFTGNGFPSFDENTVGIGLLLYYRTANEWQIGVELDGMGNTQETGASVAEYSSGRLGLWIARDLLPHSKWDFTPGAVLGWGGSDLLILSAAGDGRVQEGFAYAEPTLLLGYTVSAGTKVAIGGSYLAPIELSRKTQGDDLGVEELNPKAWSAQLQLIFGSFE